MRKELFRAESLNKSFGQEKVLKDVSFNLFEGETIVMLGANGAGKSTLMKILGGVIPKDSGRIFFQEKQIHNHSIPHAKALGIQVVYDYGSIINDFSISENIFLAAKKPTFFNPKRYDGPALEYIRLVNLNRSPFEPAASLSLPEKSKVQLAAALTADPRLLILDEPPLFTTEEDKRCLKGILDSLKARGSSAIYITHNLEDALYFADRILILRDGVSACLSDKSEFTKGTLITILSKTEAPKASIVHPPKNRELLRVEHLCSRKLSDICFQANAGEILGFVGSVESGKDAVLDALFGLHKVESGSVWIEGKKAVIRNTRDARKRHISYSTENRASHSGLLPDMDVKENLTLHSIRRISSFGWINKNMEQHFALTYLRYLYNKHVTIHTPIRHLSNGTLHKLQIAQCISEKPRLLLLYEPANGMDLNSKQETLSAIADRAAGGTTVLIAASLESDDAIKLCHRLIIMREGRIKGELVNSEITMSNIITLEQL